jgi:hypothetical protein
MPATETPSRSVTADSNNRNDAPAAANPRRRRPLVIALALAAVAAVAVVVVLLVSGDDNSDRLVLGQPREVSAAQLSSYAQAAKRPVYWAGPAARGYKLELTEVRGQRVFVRYLTADAKAGDPRAAFTTVATYPMKGAAAQLQSFKSRPGAVEGKGANGAVTLYYKKSPSNVYVAQPNSDYLVEIFAPQPRAALQLAQSDQLVQVR